MTNSKDNNNDRNEANMADDMDVDNYKEQLRQVEAALAIDEKNEDLLKLKEDLLEVIALTEELSQINEVADEVANSSSSIAINSHHDEDDGSSTHEWRVGDRVQAVRQLDGQHHTGTVDMIADDGISCTVKFDNSGTVDVVKVSTLRSTLGSMGPKSGEPDYRKEILLGIDPEESGVPGQGEKEASKEDKTKTLTKEELERRRENKKKKLLKKKQRMKEFEEAREAGKNRWQDFYKKGSLKGKHKVKGLNKKSIFASREDGKGKIGVGTCGTSGGGMTDYPPATAYMYKK